MPRPGGGPEDAEDEKYEEVNDWREHFYLSYLKDAFLRKRVMDLLENYSTLFEGKLSQISAT